MKKSFIRKSVSLLVLGALCLPMAVSARSIMDEEAAEYNNRSLRYVQQRSEMVAAIFGADYKENERQRTLLTSHLTEAVDRIIADRDAQLDAIYEERGNLLSRRALLLNTGAFRASESEEYHIINERIDTLGETVSSLTRATTERLIPLNDEINTLSVDVNARQRELSEISTGFAEDITDSQILGEVGLLSMREDEEAGRS